MEYTIRLRDRRIYEAVLGFLAEIGQNAKEATVQGHAYDSHLEKFKAVRLRTRGFRFDRNQVNERFTLFYK